MRTLGAHIAPVAAAFWAAEALAETDAISVPSGYEIYLQEVLYETRAGGATIARFRYVMPILRQDVAFAEVEADFLHLCEAQALSHLAEAGKSAAQIIVSLADREIEFGTSSALATQYFEAFRPENETCIWEGF